MLCGMSLLPVVSWVVAGCRGALLLDAGAVVESRDVAAVDDYSLASGRVRAAVVMLVRRGLSRASAAAAARARCV